MLQSLVGAFFGVVATYYYPAAKPDGSSMLQGFQSLSIFILADECGLFYCCICSMYSKSNEGAKIYRLHQTLVP